MENCTENVRARGLPVLDTVIAANLVICYFQLLSSGAIHSPEYE